MAATLGLDISLCQTWDSFRRAAVEANNGDDFPSTAGVFVDRCRAIYRVASNGERPLILAIMYSADFARQADEFAGGSAFLSFESADPEHAAAIAACIARAAQPGRVSDKYTLEVVGRAE